MYYAEQIATEEELHHIGKLTEFHSIKLNDHDVRMQNDTCSSVTIISTKIGGQFALKSPCSCPDGLWRTIDKMQYLVI